MKEREVKEYLGMESFATTTAWGEEIHNNKFIPCVQ